MWWGGLRFYWVWMGFGEWWLGERGWEGECECGVLEGISMGWYRVVGFGVLRFWDGE